MLVIQITKQDSGKFKVEFIVEGKTIFSRLISTKDDLAISERIPDLIKTNYPALQYINKDTRQCNQTLVTD